jgi:hypothetical protein
VSRWFRYYDSALDDPKVQRLPAELFKVWVNLLCVASRHDGRLPSVPDLAFALRMTDEAVDRMLRALIERGLLDRDGDGLAPHNWNGRQHKSDDSAERVRRFRSKVKQECNGASAVTVTPPDTDTDTEEREKTRDARALPPDFLDQFTEAYGKQVDPDETARVLAELVAQDLVTFAELVTAARSYASHVKPRFHCNPITWLKERRWVNERPKGGAKAAGVFVLRDSPPGRAWAAHEAAKGGKVAWVPSSRGGGIGRSMPTEWPPGQGPPGQVIALRPGASERTHAEI